MITFSKSKRVNFFKDIKGEISTSDDSKNTLVWTVLFSLLNVISHIMLFYWIFPRPSLGKYKLPFSIQIKKLKKTEEWLVQSHSTGF